jgi:pyridoxal phosphate enzyme (YggS family)
MSSIAENLAQVEECIAAACRRAGRRREEVKLVAISKTFPAERVREAYEAGLRDFGENRVQEAAAKRPALSDLAITWHLVGHLQSNKAKPARELFGWIHSIDSEKIAQKLDHAAGASGEKLQVRSPGRRCVAACRVGRPAGDARSARVDDRPSLF